MSSPSEDTAVIRRARWSWLCPLIAWASQIVFALSLRGVHGIAMGFFWAAVAVAQVVLIAEGIYLGVKVLRLGRPAAATASRREAIAGIVLSGGTVLLIAVLILSNL